MKIYINKHNNKKNLFYRLIFIFIGTKKIKRIDTEIEMINFIK